ncbi:MAG: hypothetical protein N0C90_27085, partial [Candidatus Thiodiazotropha endolucinida]|nr:hypothetical protein [Candidatus Thiodiazotropha taylori]MCW4265012.1 hypothetical protein [Candidatus Thiodiazotropha endolucinida]
TAMKNLHPDAKYGKRNSRERKDSDLQDGSPRKGGGCKTSVTNLSGVNLTTAQIRLLEKGLKFIPSKNKIDKVKLLADLGEWERRMRLREYFYGLETEKGEDKDDILNKFIKKPKSTFTPSEGRDESLDLYIELVKNDVVSNLKRRGQLNLSKVENDAFYELLHNDDIIIRPADKGSGIVVMDSGMYMQSLQDEVEKNNSYRKTDTDLSKTSLKNVKKVVNRIYRQGYIPKEMQQYLVPRYSGPGKLKGNPKLHKEKAPLRTIVSGLNTATERIAELAEHELSEFVESSPSNLRDTTDFIQKLNEIHEPLPENSVLFCFDVQKLYPSIPKNEGLKACREAL